MREPPRLALALTLGALCVLPGLPAAAQPEAGPARFGTAHPSTDALRVADWVVTSGDNQGMPFVIVDKVTARVFVLDRGGQLLGAAPALLGLARGDTSSPGIGDRQLAGISPGERTTPAGRFVSSLGQDLGGKEVVWVDYATAVTLHRVITGDPKERRKARLASATSRDNRISYGCINVPAAFFDSVVRPAFTGTSGVVYILPEVRPIDEVLPGYGLGARAEAAETAKPS